MVSTRLALAATEKEIKKENCDEFFHRVTKFILEFGRKQIDVIIDTIDKRLEMIIAQKGQRIKYLRMWLSLVMNITGHEIPLECGVWRGIILTTKAKRKQKTRVLRWINLITKTIQPKN